MIIDTHAHLDRDDYPDLDQVIERAKVAGVEKIINVGSTVETSMATIEISKTYPNLYGTVGIHPTDNSADAEAMDKILRQISDMADQQKVVAIGETGLDYFQNPSQEEKDAQKKLFIKQINIAREKNLPLVIHTRNADEDMLDILEKEKVKDAVVHCFVGDWNFARKILDLELMISFTAIITYPKTDALTEAVERVPLEKIMIDTDCPFLAPQIYRGQRNEPAYAVEIAKKIAEIKKISLEEVEDTTTENANRFFNL
jgi:TatD DNase family protein